MSIKLANAAGGSSLIQPQQSVADFTNQMPEEAGNLLAEGTVSDLLSAQAHKPNMIINPDFNVWQRGDIHSVVGYGADRWYNDTLRTMQKTTLFGRPALSLTVITGPTSTVGIQQGVEIPAGTGLNSLDNKWLTISYDILVSPGGPADAESYVQIHFIDSIENGGGFVNVYSDSGNKTPTPPGSVQRVTKTFQVTSTQQSTNTSLAVYIGSSSDIQFATGDSVTISNVKLEESEYETAFVAPSIVDELARCQRYYQKGQFAVNLDTRNCTKMTWFIPFFVKTAKSASDVVFNYSGIATPSGGTLELSVYGSNGFRVFCSALTSDDNWWTSGTWTADSEL